MNNLKRLGGVPLQLHVTNIEVIFLIPLIKITLLITIIT